MFRKIRNCEKDYNEVIKKIQTIKENHKEVNN